MPSKNPRAWLRQWITDRSGQSLDRFDDATPLFGDGPLDSTDFVELLLLIEEACDGSLDVATLKPENFRTIDAIVGSYFAEADHVA